MGRGRRAASHDRWHASYAVAPVGSPIDEAQLREHLLFHATPPPLTAQMLRDFPAELIEMGFPRHMRSVRPPSITNPLLPHS